MTTETETSPEERFFGKKHIIDDVLAENDKAEKDAAKEDEVTVETVEEGQGGIDDSPAKTGEPVKAGADGKSKTGDDELDSYSEKVQKRIDKLTWEREEANRKLTQATALQQEAVRYAQTVSQQNQQQANIIATGEARLVEQIKNRAALAVESASNKYRAAYEAGDTDAIINAQKELTIAQAEQIEGYNYEQDYQRRVQNWMSQQQRQQQFAAQAAQRPPVQQQPVQQQPVQQQQQVQPTRESKSWAQKNPWFGKNEHRDMTAIAYAEHERLIREEGVKPDSEEYYRKIDAKVLHHFPEYFQQNGAGKPNTVVAPGGRNNGGKPRTVRLEPHQVSLAKQLGLTPEQYARQVLKESK